jgi:DNA-binding ferritin-like protein
VFLRQERNANMASGNINDPKHWHDRAAEMRALAETMKEIMHRLADHFDKLADRAAQRRAQSDQEPPNK